MKPERKLPVIFSETTHLLLREIFGINPIRGHILNEVTALVGSRISLQKSAFVPKRLTMGEGKCSKLDDAIHYLRTTL